MIKLEDYCVLLKILENEIKNIDITLASNIARELSAIYLKCTYIGPQSETATRLSSMINYIEKTIPDYSHILTVLLNDIIINIKNNI